MHENLDYEVDICKLKIHLVDGFLYGVADFGDLVDAPDVPGGVRDADGGHVEAGPVEARPLAQLLDDLHHHSLPVALVTDLKKLHLWSSLCQI